MTDVSPPGTAGTEPASTPNTVAPGRQLFGAASRICGLVTTLFGLVIVGRRGERYGWSTFVRADGIPFVRIARDLGGAHLGRGDDTYRYGRILYPFLGRVAAGGSSHGVLLSLPLINAFAIGLVAACGCELGRRRVGRPLVGIAVLLAPGLWFCLFIVWSDALVTALVMLTCLLWVADRRAAAIATVAAAALTKEVGILGLVPMVYDDISRRRFREAGLAGLAVLPLAAWWTWVRYRLGEWPAFGGLKGPARSGAFGLPFNGLAPMVRTLTADHAMVVLSVAIITAGALAGLIRLRGRWAPVPGTALCFALLNLCLGPNSLRYLGDALRIMVTSMVLVILIVVEGVAPASPPPTARRAPES